MKKIKPYEIYSLVKKKAQNDTKKIIIRDCEIEKKVGLAKGQLCFFKTQQRKFITKKVADKFSAYLGIDVDNFEYKITQGRPKKIDVKKEVLKTVGRNMLALSNLNFMVECKK